MERKLVKRSKKVMLHSLLGKCCIVLISFFGKLHSRLIISNTYVTSQLNYPANRGIEMTYAFLKLKLDVLRYATTPLKIALTVV
tara:strand:+ start:319098 stop:319349 length:252 start_codon:yes stop_codon:yes gene_type:complete